MYAIWSRVNLCILNIKFVVNILIEVDQLIVVDFCDDETITEAKAIEASGWYIANSYRRQLTTYAKGVEGA